MSRRSTLERAAGPGAIAILGSLLLLAAESCAPEQSGPPLPRSILLYEEGRFEEALTLLRQETARDEDGTILYRIGFAEHLLDRDRDKKMRTWGEAERLLEAEIASEGSATLERLYYLAKINAEQYEDDAMLRFARRAVEQFEEEGDPSILSGGDWYKLGYLHELMNEESRAEAAYRMAHSVFERQADGQQIYRALAAARVADFDFDGGRYERAAEAYDRAASLAPSLELVHPFQHGLALFGAGRLDDAVERFEHARAGDGRGAAGADPERIAEEAKYAADLVHMGLDVGEIENEDVDGADLTKLQDHVLDGRIRDAAQAYRGVRRKYAYRSGDPLPAEMKTYQRRFVALMRERLIRRAGIKEFCASESIEDLVHP